MVYTPDSLLTDKAQPKRLNSKFGGRIPFTVLGSNSSPKGLQYGDLRTKVACVFYSYTSFFITVYYSCRFGIRLKDCIC